MKNYFVKKIKEKNGQGRLEYVVIMTLLVVVSISALGILSDMLLESFNRLEETMVSIENTIDENTLVAEKNNNEMPIEMNKNDNMKNVATLTPTVFIQQEKQEKQKNKISFIRDNETIFCEYEKIEQRGNYYYIETNDRHYWLTPNEIKTLSIVGE